MVTQSTACFCFDSCQLFVQGTNSNELEETYFKLLEITEYPCNKTELEMKEKLSCFVIITYQSPKI